MGMENGPELPSSSGAIRGMDELTKPNEEGPFATFVETTHDDPNNRLLAGPPPNGILWKTARFGLLCDKVKWLSSLSQATFRRN